MRISLISGDARLHSLCREIRGQVPDCEWCDSASRDTHADGDGAADLYIFDFEPGARVPSEILRNPLRHLFLADRKDVPALQTCLGHANANILLKPVTQATLTALLGLALSANDGGAGGTAETRAERDEMLQCLIQTNLKLQEFDQDRTNFLARALHDFNAPLTAIGGYCDLLVNEALGPLTHEQKEILRKMSRGVQRLSGIASAMYELSSGRCIHPPLDRREADIEACIDQALGEAQLIAAAKELSMVPIVYPASGVLVFDPGVIEQVLVSLLENACKFTPKGGTVELLGYPFFWERRKGSTAPVAGDRRRRVSNRPNAYRIDILNAGAAIPDYRLNQLFEEHTSYSGGQDRSGGGLGLAICKMHIARHDGRIWAENRDSGPALSFVLPVKTTKAAICRSSDSEDSCERQQTKQKDYSRR